ncbi:MAG TPA: hypothetical protein VIV61_07630, partial [Candidatus Ozemobacteraceae bacterium]
MMPNRFTLRSVVVLLVFGIALQAAATAREPATPSVCRKSPVADARGDGPRPYNFRVIDDHLFAGGTLFHPVTGANPDALVRRYLRELKGMGAKTVITLHVPSGRDRQLERLRRLCREEGLAWLPCRMTAEQVPDASQTARLLGAIDGGAYVHCQWGCDRTGAVIAKYLRERHGWSGIDAWKAVIANGSHAGPIGGFKQKP